MFTPGTYLRKRREAAGLSIEDVARRLAAMPFPIGTPHPAEVAHLATFLREVEADNNNLTYGAALTLRNAYPFDVEAHWHLLVQRYDPDSADLPQPKLCRQCACSFHDACEVEGRPCAWSEADPALCTACERAAATQPEGATL